MDTAEIIPAITEKELPANIKKLWLKALSAIELRNHDFAISLLQNVVKQQPHFLDGRRYLRRSEIIKKSGEKKLFKFGGGVSAMKLQSALKKDPLAALVDIEKALETDPYGQKYNEALFDATMAAGMPETATFALETLREGHPKNKKNLHKLAEHLLIQNEADRAAEIYEEIVELDPTDMDAVKGSKDSVAAASMKNQGWEQASSFKDLLKDKDQTAKLESQNRAAMTREQMEEALGELAGEYEKDPNNVQVVKKIADLYEKLEDFDQARAYFSWAVQLSPGDVALQNKVDALEEKVQESEITQLETYIAENEGAEDLEQYQTRLSELKQQKFSTGIEHAKAAVERNPTDKQLRFNLGEHYHNAGMYTEAMPELQQAKTNPHLKLKATLILGKCFAAKKMFDMAAGQLEEASAAIPTMDGVKKDLLYELGNVYEKMGDNDKAITAFKEIFNADFGYRDVAKRVEASYAS